MDTGIGIALGFLLPAGLWLVLTAAAPRGQENHAAASGMLAIAIATLAFFAFGFAFFAGGLGATLGLKQFAALSSYAAAPLGGQMWGVIGLRGFALSNTGVNELLLCMTYLPLAQTASVLTTSALYRRVSYPAQALAAFLAGGVLLPIIGFWVWGGGWLARLGVGASLGHGAVDLNGLTLAALVAGAVAAAWLARLPRATLAPVLPAAGLPMRAFAGMALALAGLMGFAATSPLLKSLGAGSLAGLAINGAAGMAGGALTGMAYAAFVSRRADTLLAVRCALATLIGIAAGGATLPPLVALLMGLGMGIAMPVVDFAIKQKLLLPDDEFAIAGIFLPALLGMILPGLFAQGNIGAGWNGVGAEQYLGVKGLGIVGILGAGSAPDMGQLSAQFIAVAVVCAIGGALGFAFARVFAPAPNPSDAAEKVTGAKSITPPTLDAEAEGTPYTPPEEQLALLLELPAIMPVAPASAPDQPHGETPQPEPSPSTPNQLRTEGGILARLRNMQAQRDRPAAPKQARKVAYPTRVGGRRLFTRPVAEEQEPKSL